jgi:hypothetical protein
VKKRFLLGLLILPFLMGQQSCNGGPPQSTTGVQKATATVAVQSSGYTIEQENIRNRLAEDNKPGSVKHLYVISAMSGDVLLYSTVKGKVTSSGKRLTPYESVGSGETGCYYGFAIDVGGALSCTAEILQDDGTYGSSVEYIFWWDSRGVYHQHYVTGGQIVHVSNAPMRVGKIVINVDTE